MKQSVYKTLAIALLSCGLIAGCSSDDDDDDSGVAGPGDGGTAIPGDGIFAFSDVAFDSNLYTRVDRMGMPAIATALIDNDDGYNAADPVDDAAGAFVPEIVGTLNFLHDALDTQLEGLGLTPCTVDADGNGTCVAFAGPLILPDTLKIDTATAAGFPNGRLLADPIIAVTLAVALLELTTTDGSDPAHTPVDLVGALNPPSDSEFRLEFPFLAIAN